MLLIQRVPENPVSKKLCELHKNYVYFFKKIETKYKKCIKI